MSNKYCKPQVIMHWISATIIIWATLSGFYVAIFKPAPIIKEIIGFFNVSITTVFIPLFVYRVWLALTRKKPEESGLTAKEERMAHLGHIALYINISIVLITGVLMMERDINVFNILIIPQPISAVNWCILFNKIHIASCASLGLLVLGHILAVIGHQLKGRRILQRMFF